MTLEETGIHFYCDVFAAVAVFVDKVAETNEHKLEPHHLPTFHHQTHCYHQNLH